jgi:SNF2 family DNA or RNA helicase
MASGFVYETTRTASDRPGKFDVSQKTVWFSDHKLELLDELLEENQRANTIIVYNYQAELAELQRRYPKAATIDQPGVIDAWNRGEIELLLIHPKSAGHGLNLQHGGCRMVFLSLPWSLEEYEQVIGRLHRSGQRHDVWVYVLLTDKTIDEKIWMALRDKRAMSDVAMWELK